VTKPEHMTIHIIQHEIMEAHKFSNAKETFCWLSLSISL